MDGEDPDSRNPNSTLTTVALSFAHIPSQASQDLKAIPT
jgi:hypothetical protein